MHFIAFEPQAKTHGVWLLFRFAGAQVYFIFLRCSSADCRHCFVFKVDEFGFQFKRCLRAFFDAFAAATTFVGVDYDVVFA